MDSINLITEKHRLAVIEDVYQAHGALYKGRKAGRQADYLVVVLEDLSSQEREHSYEVKEKYYLFKAIFLSSVKIRV